LTPSADAGAASKRPHAAMAADNGFNVIFFISLNICPEHDIL
jgi:hypothetical protein